MFLENCKVVENRNIAENMFLLVVKGDKTIEHTKEGQFFMLEVKKGLSFLRRPISIHYVNKDTSELEFYYEVKGRGTQELAALKKDDIINIQGPLGNGFDSNIENKNIVVVGGGMGIAPMKLLIEKLVKKGNKVIFIAGGRTKSHVEIIKNIDLKNVKTYITTDDGSTGIKGRVDTVLKEVLDKEKIDVVYTCGPEKMMECVATISQERKVRCFVSLEARMACGIKACVGCSIKTKEGMKKVCYDGPVFESTMIVDTHPKENVVGCCGN